LTTLQAGDIVYHLRIGDIVKHHSGKYYGFVINKKMAFWVCCIPLGGSTKV
jgi:hypothetical protein